MPALVLWCLAGCPTGLPRPVPLGPPDTDVAPIDTDTDTDAETDVPHRVDLDAEITYPANGDVFELGDTVILEGEARVDGHRVSGAEFRWSSSRDGWLGDVSEVPWTPTSPGRHTI